MAELSSLLKSLVPLQGRCVLGLDGLSRAGKSTFVNQVQVCIEESGQECMVFHIDDFIVKRENRYDTGRASWEEYYFLQWDIEWLKDNFFELLKETSSVSLPYYQKSDDHEWKEILIPDDCVILIEGVFLQRKEWRSYFDYVIFLDCPRETRFRRESEQAQQEKETFVHRYWPAEDYYVKKEKPIEFADFVIKN
ncbi:kinase [Radiobacillus deserti]|uniref:Phosphoribulokinase/uridine kinase domain-containing protein n=1 Tax=Radiobacillus deserti TaxID=2594883 RepID=A0A516KJY1_9BACI|nr:kinase [Radiobacillus deserti]QDP41720.1 hypothetical protein FN924_16985 [Radiobacillus deserti]